MVILLTDKDIHFSGTKWHANYGGIHPIEISIHWDTSIYLIFLVMPSSEIQTF